MTFKSPPPLYDFLFYPDRSLKPRPRSRNKVNTASTIVEKEDKVLSSFADYKSAVNGKVDQLEIDARELNKEVTAREHTVGVLHDAKTVLYIENTNLQAKLKEVEKQLEEKRGELALTQRALSDSRVAYTKVTEEKAVIEVHVESLTEKLKRAEGRLQDVDSALVQVITDLQTEVSRLQNDSKDKGERHVEQVTRLIGEKRKAEEEKDEWMKNVKLCDLSKG